MTPPKLLTYISTARTKLSIESGVFCHMCVFAAADPSVSVSAILCLLMDLFAISPFDLFCLSVT